MSRDGRAAKSNHEADYLNKLLDYVSQANVRNAYVEPVLQRALQAHHRALIAGNLVPAYETVFASLKRAAVAVAKQWKLEHVMVTGLSKAALDRQAENLAQTFMEVYQARASQQRNARGEARKMFGRE